ncbi:MAG: hypothetical protein ACI94Y_004565 [Maribacter sp.]|jgi:hypothetical protein
MANTYSMLAKKEMLDKKYDIINICIDVYTSIYQSVKKVKVL